MRAAACHSERSEESVLSPLALAAKLVALAEAQLEALQRDAQSQFDWLVLRRDLVTQAINRQVAAGLRLPPEATAKVAGLQRRLAELDAAMEQHVRGRMDQVRHKRAALTHTRKVMAPYLLTNFRKPAFIDTRS